MEKKSKRTGFTEITSISLSKEFKRLCEEYEISPTWAVRKGIAIELFERGVVKYQSDLNRKRYEEIQDWLKSHGDLEQLKKDLSIKIQPFLQKMRKIQKIIGELDEEEK
jgi:hypothetical protein